MVSVIVEVIEGVDFFTKIPPKSDRLEMEARVPRHCRYHLAYSPSTGMWSHPLVIPHGPPSDDSSAFPAKLCQEKVDASPNGLTHKIAYDDIFQVLSHNFFVCFVFFSFLIPISHPGPLL